MNKPNTSWGEVANWYDELLEKTEGTFQKEVILPNLLRLLDPKKDEVILDLACGQGFFTREIFKTGAKIAGSDISKELISIAIANSPRDINFHVSPADNISYLANRSVDKIIIVLALQNIENFQGVLAECSRILKPKGRLLIVMNHPAFRVPKSTSWEYSETDHVQFRRVDRYMSEKRERIEMNPGDKNAKKFTVTFHRPLQVYFKALYKNNFYVARLEEWTSHKESKPGPRAFAENQARKEIPMFMVMDARLQVSQ